MSIVTTAPRGCGRARDAQGMGVFDRGGGGCHSEGSIRDRSVGKELWQHPSERIL